MKGLVVLGSTGSIGRQTLDIVRQYPERLRVVGLSAGRNVGLLAEQIEAFRPQWVAVGDAAACEQLRQQGIDDSVTLLGSGEEALCDLARQPCDVVINALLGYAGLRPTLAALEEGHDVALSNKETLVAAGEIVCALARRSGARLLPVDSEHAALDQCLRGGAPHEVRRLILTASGGPFRRWTSEQMQQAKVEDALNHPTWNMGRKITIDSATLMNKGLEIIEAHWLFDVAYADIDVLVHPQSIVHSLVEFRDGSVLAQMGTTDMRLPIWSAIHSPERPAASFGRLDLSQIGRLTFEEVDERRFPCVGLAVRAGRQGGVLPAVLNAANEVAVQAFLEGRIPFPAIAATIAATLDACSGQAPPAALDVGTIAAADSEARRLATESTRRLTTSGDRVS
jgi:1-deoxy-D-xylulose-5-phosphate reductoisomerase